jgi:hypothetical protein
MENRQLMMILTLCQSRQEITLPFWRNKSLGEMTTDFQTTTKICTSRGPWAPVTGMLSMSRVVLGPEMRLI